jgi:hypothetical protein
MIGTPTQPGGGPPPGGDDEASRSADATPAPGPDEGVEARLAAMEARVRALLARVHELESPLGRVFLVKRTGSPTNGTFAEMHPEVDPDDGYFTIDGGRAVSDTAAAEITLRDAYVDPDDPAAGTVEAVLGFQNGSNAAYVPIGGGGADYYQVETLIVSKPPKIRISDKNNTDDILELLMETMMDGSPVLSIAFKDLPSGYPVLQGNAGNVVWDGVRVDNI